MNASKSKVMDKILLTLSCLFTAFCWLSLCFDWDLTMYLSGIVALILIMSSDLIKKNYKEKGKEEK